MFDFRHILKMKHFIIIILLVHCPSKRAATTGSDLVRRVTGFQKKKYNRSEHSSGQAGNDVSCLLYNFHGGASLEHGTFHEKTICQIYCTLGFVWTVFK